jgi:hypothetical protein
MTGTASRVFDAALELQEDERGELISALILSLEDATEDPAAEEAWNVEIRRRLQSIEDGSAKFVDWPTLRDRLWAKRKK